MSLIDYLLGRRLATYEEGEQRVGVMAGIPMLGLDALGSAAYGPEAALTLLIPLGAAGVSYIGPISTLIIVLLDGRLLLLPPDDRGVSAGRRVVHGRQGEPGHDRRACSPRRRSCSTTCWSWPSASRRGSGPWSRRCRCLQPHTLSLCLAILALDHDRQPARRSRIGAGLHGSDLSVHRLAAGGAGHRRCQDDRWPSGHPVPVDAAAACCPRPRRRRASGS